LIITCDKIDDSAFRDNFFIAYRQIIKPEVLMEMLLKRFKEASIEDQDADSFVPNMRASAITPLSTLGTRRGSISKREKKVGLKGALNVSNNAVVVSAPFVLVPQNLLRRVVVARVMRRWLTHSPMDFDLKIAGGGVKKRELTSSRLGNKSFANFRGHIVKVTKKKRKKKKESFFLFG
jgi:hypothetical protein